MLKTFFYLVTVNAFQIDLWKQNKEIFFITMKIWNNNKKKKNLFVKPNIPIFPSFFVLSTPLSVSYLDWGGNNHFNLWKRWTLGYVDSSGYLHLHVQFSNFVPTKKEKENSRKSVLIMELKKCFFILQLLADKQWTCI